MKKTLSIIIAIFLIFCIYIKVYASGSFQINIDNFNFDSDITEQQTVNKLEASYKINAEEQIDSETKNELMRITKKYAYLYLGGNVDNDIDDFETREYELGYGEDKYDYNAKDENGKYNVQSTEYSQVWASEWKNSILINMFENGDICYDEISSIDFNKRQIYVGDIKVSDYVSIVTIDNVVINDIFDLDEHNRLTYKSDAEEILEQDDIPYTNIKLNLFIFIVDDDGTKKVAWADACVTDSIDSYVEKGKNNEIKSNLEVSEYIGADLEEYYDWSKLNNISNEQAETIYNNNVKNILILQAYNGDNIVSSANGIFIKNGIILTSWTFIEDSLQNSADIVIKDTENNTYKIDGIVTADIESDIAVIKLKSENDNNVSLSFNKNLDFEDPVIMISSKSGVNLSISKGINISNSENIQASIVSTDNEKGAPVFDINGNLVGIVSANSKNISVSQIVNVKYIEELYNKFNSLNFEDIKSNSYNDMKKDYYLKEAEVNKTLSLTDKQWSKIKTIGNLESTIYLDLIKSSYYKGIYSLRYYNNINSITSSIQMAYAFMDELENSGYTRTLDSDKKVIYENDDYKIAIMDEFDYLIIVISEK